MLRPLAGARMDLVCLPFVGASASAYREWPAIMAPLAQVHAVQLPGRGPRWREPAVGSLTELLDTLQVIVAASVRRPFVLFGHSFGALLAFELSRRLRARGGPTPALLAVSGRVSPHAATATPPDPDAPSSWLIEHLRQLGGTPEAVLTDPELIELVLPALREDYRLLGTWRYQPEPPLDIPIVAYVGLDDASAPLDAMIGWEQQTCADFDLVSLPGGHFYTSEGLVEPATQLRRRLARQL